MPEYEGDHAAAVRRMRLGGLGYKAIARRIGVSRDRVRQIAKKLDLDGVRGPVTPRKSRPVRGGTARCAICGAVVHLPGPGKRGRTPRFCSQNCRQRGDDKKKLAARDALQKAVREGRIARPTACSSCGARGHIAAHHSDYDKPLDVEWLCRTCHNARHASPSKRRSRGA